MKKIVGLIILLGWGGLMFSFYQSSSFLISECGMSNGPCEGIDVETKLADVNIDEYIEIPNGQLAFVNIDNELVPIMIKLNLDRKIEWAKQLITATKNCEIAMYKMEILKLEENKNEIIIRIFNHSHSEPGVIYLDKNYNFKMMCLRPF